MKEEFPKADLISLKLSKGKWLFLYSRLSNAGHLFFGPIEITWRLPWDPWAAWRKGWDAHFRQENNLKD
jgi:hypothetical protein